MNETYVRRLRMALELFRLTRYQSQLCRRMPLAVVLPGSEAEDDTVETARWLGTRRIGNRNHHALFVPPGVHATYRFAAPARARFVVSCGLIAGAAPDGAPIEFLVTIRDRRTSQERHASVRLSPGDAQRWHELALDLDNAAVQQIELTLTTRTALPLGPEHPQPVWGEPRFEWRRPIGELREIVLDAGRLAFRGRLMDAARTLHGRLSERSHSTLYRMWLQQRASSPERLADMTRRAESLACRPLVSVVTPVYNTDAGWLRACIESVRNQAYSNWQLCLVDDGSTRPGTHEVLREYEGDPRIRIRKLETNRGIAVASNEALALAEGEFVAFLDHDDELAPEALLEVVAHLNEHPDSDFIFSDEDKLELDGRRSDVYFKPGWSPDHFLTNMYTCHLMVVRRTLLQQIGGFRGGYEGAQDYDLVLRLSERTTRIHHVPKVLYHWRKIPESTAGSRTAKPWAHDAGKLALEDYLRRNRLEGEVLPGRHRYMYRVRYRIQGEPLISIVLPALPEPDRHGREGLQACERFLELIDQRTAYRRFEVVVPVRDAAEVNRLQAPSALTLRTVLLDAPPCRSTLGQQKRAAAHAHGDHLLFLSWGLQPMDADWLAGLLEFSQLQPVGAVGAKLHHPDGSLKHIGILLGVNGVAARALHRHPRSSMGYWGTAIAARNYSAVSGECLMTRRAVYDQIGGFDDDLGAFADVDYCLRATAAGYRVVFTPHAALMDDGSCERPDTAGGQEARRLQVRWSARLARDPYYNPNLSRDAPDYEPDLSRQDESARTEEASPQR